MNTVVVSKLSTEYDVYIGRGSIFGNPFKISKDCDRACVIEKYRNYFASRIKYDVVFHSAVLKLKGKRLGCFCKPKACHGDVIVEYLEGTV